jgi:hypothetical protein
MTAQSKMQCTVEKYGGARIKSGYGFGIFGLYFGIFGVMSDSAKL